MKTFVVYAEGIFGPWRKLAVEIPDGWYRVLSGAVKPGDRYLNAIHFRQGEVWWEDVGSFPAATGPPLQRGDVLDDGLSPNDLARYYLCLIRKGQPVEVLCPRCFSEPVRLGYRYCKHCCSDMVRTMRRTQERDS